CALLTHALQEPDANPEKSQATTPLPRREGAPTEEPHVAEKRARPQAPAPVAIGETLSTKQGERRRVALPDGSILYLNEKTTVQFDAERHLRLSTGEVFIEVSPREQGSEAATFVVQTPRREVSALGTRFAVQADAGGTGVVVTQGKVK